MNYLQPIAFLTLLTLAACASTDNGKTGDTSPKKNKTTKNEATAPKSKENADTKSNGDTKATDDKSAEKPKTVEETRTTPNTVAKPAVVNSKPTAIGKALAGLYFARLPCPGCGHVRVNLILEANQTYDKTEEYLASNEIFFDKGTWTMVDNKLILVPQANTQSTESTIRWFNVRKDALFLVTKTGKPYPGNLSDYRFKKK